MFYCRLDTSAALYQTACFGPVKIFNGFIQILMMNGIDWRAGYLTRRVACTAGWTQFEETDEAAGNLRFSRMVAIFPVIWDSGIAENKSDESGETRLGANVVREDDYATLARLDADHGICGLPVMAALEVTVSLRAVEGDKPQARVQILALFI